jgi:hypothetical protein
MKQKKEQRSNKCDRYVLFLTFLYCILTSRNKKLRTVRTKLPSIQGRKGSNKLKGKRRNCALFYLPLSYFYAYNPATRLCLTATAATACIDVIREPAYKTGREQMAQ